MTESHDDEYEAYITECIYIAEQLRKEQRKKLRERGDRIVEKMIEESTKKSL
jgi:hypothetical protein